MAGSAIVRALQPNPEIEVITRDRSELDLTNESQTRDFFEDTRPDITIFAAAKVGGIQANSQNPVEFMIQNLRMATNAIQSSFETGVSRFVFLGSTCIYPRMAPQPLTEDSLLSGTLEPTNEAYALAKIAGLKLCQYYRQQHGVCYHSVMPTNLYGPGDNFDPETSHVIPALIRKVVEARAAGTEVVDVWGTGQASREFLYVADAARGVVLAAEHYNRPEPVNLGSGTEITIAALATLICDLCGYRGRLRWDSTQPDGQPRRCLDTSRAKQEFGFQASTSFRDGLLETIRWYEQHRSQAGAATANAPA